MLGKFLAILAIFRATQVTSSHLCHNMLSSTNFLHPNRIKFDFLQIFAWILTVLYFINFFLCLKDHKRKNQRISTPVKMPEEYAVVKY